MIFLSFDKDSYELLKPESTLPPNATSVLAEYTEELAAILAESLEKSRERTLRSLMVLRDQYIAK